MTQCITVEPTKNGTAVVTLAPVDENNDALTYAQLNDPRWQLQRASDGTIINDRDFARSQVPALEFELTGDDLAIFTGLDSGERILGFQATYSSIVNGVRVDNLPLTDEAQFDIRNLKSQPNQTP